MYTYEAFTLYGFPFQKIPLDDKNMTVVRTPKNRFLGLGCSPFARHYSGNHWIIFFSSGYLDVSVLRVSLRNYANARSSIGRVVPFGNLWL